MKRMLMQCSKGRPDLRGGVRELSSLKNARCETALRGDGVSRRMLGTLLNWIAERTQAVFLVATANDLSRLPPESEPKPFESALSSV